jgi:hypothetical protein
MASTSPFPSPTPSPPTWDITAERAALRLADAMEYSTRS